MDIRTDCKTYISSNWVVAGLWNVPYNQSKLRSRPWFVLVLCDLSIQVTFKIKQSIDLGMDFLYTSLNTMSIFSATYLRIKHSHYHIKIIIYVLYLLFCIALYLRWFEYLHSVQKFACPLIMNVFFRPCFFIENVSLTWPDPSRTICLLSKSFALPQYL